MIGRAVGAVLLLAAGAAFAVGSLGGSGGSFLPSSSQVDAPSSSAGGSGEATDPSQGAAGAETGGGEGAAGQAQATTDVAQGNVLVVHVDGAVASPGVYELRGASPRRRDAVEAAGGLVAGADTTLVNLAAPLSDGEKLHVPFEGEQAWAPSGTSGQAQAGSASPGGGLVNLNTADAEELCTLPGVGEATAADIVADRERNGPFASVEDLMRVSGIGERKLERLRERVCV